MAKLEYVHVVPTYACNLACPYCYAAKYRGEYPQMNWPQFKKILDQLVSADVQKIVFIGGEPTIWPHLPRAIEAAKSLGMSVSLLTNGMLFPEALPDAALVNATNLSDPKLRPTILANSKKYREAGVHVGLRFNLGVSDSPAKIKKYVAWAEKYADSVSFSPTVPYELDRKLGQVLFDFAKLALKKIKTVTLNRAVPLCLFADEQLDFLRKNCNLYSVCDPGERSFVINPDSTTLPCVDLALPAKIRASFEIPGSCKKEILKLKRQPIKSLCENCSHFPENCQGGCLSMKCNKNG